MKRNTNVPVWDLSYIYKSINDPKIFKDIELYLKRASIFNKKYSTKVGKLKTNEFLKALIEFETIIEKAVIPLWYLDLMHTVDVNNQDLISKIGKAEIAKRLLQEASLPFQKRDELDKVLTIIDEMTETVPAYQFGFRPDQSALDYFQSII
jgi:oligoendopeptidase F